MKVRQLVGRLAGHIVDMPYHVAQACLANGTAVHPDQEVTNVRGLPPFRGDVEEAAADRMIRPEQTARKARKGRS